MQLEYPGLDFLNELITTAGQLACTNGNSSASPEEASADGTPG
jgi:hypothetical protein